MNGEILSIETAEKIAKLEKENKELRIKCDFLTNKKMLESDKRAKQVEIKVAEQIDYKTRNEKAIDCLNSILTEAYLDESDDVDIGLVEYAVSLLLGEK